MKILINFCFFFNNEYAIILFTFLLFVLPNKLELQWLDSCTRIETLKKTLDFNDVPSLQLQFFRQTLRDLHE